MTGTPERSEVSRRGAMSALCPNRWTGRMAFVFDVMTDAIARASILNVPRSMSTNTGRAPSLAIAPAVAKNENGVVTTSSPGPTSSAINAASSASVPEDTPTAYGMPRNASSSRSSASTSGPRMNCCASQTRVTASSTSARSGANCALRSTSGTFWAGINTEYYQYLVAQAVREQGTTGDQKVRRSEGFDLPGLVHAKSKLELLAF